VFTAVFHRRRFPFLAVGAALAALMLAACGGAGSTADSSSGVLTMSATTENAVAKNFNPFSPTSALNNQGLGLVSLIYEPLLQFDLAQPKTYPWLATKYEWSDGGKAITFTIRPGVKWSNGTPFTPADVAFTYNLLMRYPAINTGGVQLTSVQQSGDTVTLHFPKPQYQRLEEIASVQIVPQSVYGKVGNPATYVDGNPAGTGPFTLSSFTAQEIILKKNPSYWQPGLPKINEIDTPVYSSDSTLQEALQSDQVDWAGDFIPGIQKIYVSKSPYHHFWGAPIYTIALDPNLRTWPTNNLAVRQAISLAVDRQALSSQAESGQDPALTDAAGLVNPLRGYLDPSLASTTLTHDVTKAKQVLTSAGFVMGSDGFFHTKSGKTLSVQISDPSAFADWVEAGSIMVQDLRSAGIDASFVSESVSGFRANLAQGNYQLAQWFGTLSPGTTPYSLYNDWLSSSLTAPIGKTATGDFERLDNPAIDSQLNALANASNTTAAMQALKPIEQYVATQLPVIPTVQEVAFDEYNDQHFTGWPSASNPYEEGNPSNLTNEVVLLHLTPKS
jgi:peptide/nickel transport system substrate-binding protein